jgi:hypothetical protein
MRPRKKPRAGGTAARGSWRTAPAPSALALSDDERWILDINAKSMIAAMVGWFVCAFFASVAFNWTFYYVLALAVAGREIVVSRRGVVETAGERESAGVPRLVVSRV